MKKILVLSRYDRLGASSRVRIYQYLPYLEKKGFSVRVCPLFTSGYLSRRYSSGSVPLLVTLGSYTRRVVDLLSVVNYDLIWIEKELFPMAPAFFERLLAMAGKRYLVDYDDAIFHNYDLSDSRMIRFLLGRKIDVVMRNASAVIAGNAYLAEHASRAGARSVKILPTVVDTGCYEVAPALRKDGPVTIGWIGSPSTSKYLTYVEPALSRLSRAANVKLVLIGAAPVSLGSIDIEYRRWSEKTEVADIQSCDVGIMPLPNDSWEKGKCGYKLIQFMACGKPVVASPVGVNSLIVEDSVNGFVALDNEQWFEALLRLCVDEALRGSMGRSARAKVEAEYSLHVNAPKLCGYLEELGG